MSSAPRSRPPSVEPDRPSAVRQLLTRHVAYKWLVLATTGTGALLSTMDGGILSVTYPALTEAFSSSPSIVVWVSLAYFLTSLGLLLTMGSIADTAGRGRIFTVGLAVWTLGLGLSATATSIYQLIAYGAIQGIGAAMVVATLNALLVAAFPPQQRGLAMGLAGIAVGVGASIGPFMGGLLLHFLDWRAVFYARVPVGLVGLAMGWALLDRERRPGPVRADYAGALALFALLTALLLGINQAGRLGVTSPLVIGALAAAILLVPVFIMIERRAAWPILDLSLFRSPSFRGGLLSLVFLYQSWTVVSLLAPFLIINGMGLSAFRAGVFLTSFAALRLVLSPLSGWLTDRVGPQPLMVAGVLITAGGTLFLSRLDATSTQGTLLLALIVGGVGTAIYDPANASSVMGSVASGRLGTAGAGIATARQIGLSVGLAMGAALFTSRAASYAGISAANVAPATLPVGALASGIRDALLVAAALSLVAVPFALAGRRRRDRRPANPS